MISADVNDVIPCENTNIKEEHVKKVYHVCCQEKVLTYSLNKKRCEKKSRNKNASSLCHEFDETQPKNAKPTECKRQPTSRYMQCISKCNNVTRSIVLGAALAMVSGLKYTQCGYAFGCETVKEVYKHVQNAVIVPIKEKWRTLQLSPVSGRHGTSSCVWDTVENRSDSGSQTKTKCNFERVETIGKGGRDVETQSSLKYRTNGQLTDGPLSWVPSYKPGEMADQNNTPVCIDKAPGARPMWGPARAYALPPGPVLSARPLGPAAESHTPTARVHVPDRTDTGPRSPTHRPSRARPLLNRYKVAAVSACRFCSKLMIEMLSSVNTSIAYTHMC